MGTSSFLRSPPISRPSSSSSSSPLSLSSRPTLLYFRNAHSSRRKIFRAPMASLHHQIPPLDLDSCKRRALLVLGISIFPFLPWRDQAYAVENELITGKEIQKPEKMGQKRAPSNPFLSLLNAIGIFSSGVLAALYSLARNDKAKSEKMIESLETQLKEKDATIVSLEENFEVKLLYQKEEYNELLDKAKEKQLSLVNRLELANSTVAGLGRELQREKRKIDVLQSQIGNLEIGFREAGEDKQALENKVNEKQSSISVLQEKLNVLSSEIKEKNEVMESLNSSLTQMDSDYKQTRHELDARNSEIVSLRDELIKNQHQIDEKISAIDDMANRISSLVIDRDKLTEKFNALETVYDDLKSSSIEKADSDAVLLQEREKELVFVKEKYENIVSEASAKEARISELTKDSDNLKRMLDIETDNVMTLKHELQRVESTLVSSGKEISDLNNQLSESRKLCSGIEAVLSEVRSEYSRALESLQKSLNEATLHSEAVTMELNSVKDVLKKTQKDLEIVSNELSYVSENRDKLQKELAEVYKKAEEELKEERSLVVSLNNQLEALEKQMSKERDMRKSLEMNLNEISSNALILSKELEISKAQISTIEEERGFLNFALEKEREFAQEARENLEDARSVVTKLGIERESLAKRGKKLAQDLAFAKGEILRLRSQLNSSKKEVIDSKLKQESEPIVNGETTDSAPEESGVGTVKKTRRRRKAISEN